MPLTHEENKTCKILIELSTKFRKPDYNPQKRLNGISLIEDHMRSNLLKIKIHCPHDSKVCKIQNQMTIRVKVLSTDGDSI